MQRHILRLRYDGLRAETGELAPSASKQVIAGAQMFLGAHAHYFTEARIPDRILDRTHSYEIGDLARRRGSWEADFALNILANGVWDVVKFGFGLFVLQSYKAWSEGRLFEDPPYERIEPILEMRGSQNWQFIDLEAERFEQRRRLFARVSDAMALITAPNGSSSTYVEIFLDDQQLGTIERRVFAEADITAAVHSLVASRRVERLGR